MSTGETLRAIILTADRFEDLEVLYPYFRLLEDGIHVEISAPNKGQIQGEHGYTVEPTRPFDESTRKITAYCSCLAAIPMGRP